MRLRINAINRKDLEKKKAIVFLLTDCLSREELEMTLEALLRLKTKKDFLFSPLWGICSNFSRMYGGIYCGWDSTHKEKKCFTILKHLMRHWKYYSGDSGYPVPSTIKGMTAEDIYYNGHYKECMWKETHDYGRLRMNLLNWLITCIYLSLKERT